MNKKYIIALLGLSTLLVTSSNIAFAQTATSPAYPKGRNIMKVNPNKGINANENLTTIQQKADQLITQRITSLNTMLARIASLNKLTYAQKNQYTTQINANISGLSALKAKIDADTDVTTALADTKSIYTTYRVYGEFEPQTGMLATSDALGKSTDQLSLLVLKLQTRISSASATNNTAALTLLLTDMQSKIQEAKSQTANAQSGIANLTPSTFNASPSGTQATFKNARGLMTSARNDLKLGLQDAIKILAGLKAFKTTITTTPAVTVPTETSIPLSPTPTI